MDLHLVTALILATGIGLSLGVLNSDGCMNSPRHLILIVGGGAPQNIKHARETTTVNSVPPTKAERGTGWVVVQFALMFALLAAGLLWRAQWRGWWTWPTGGALLLVGAWAGLRGGRDLGAQRTPFPRPKDVGQLITTGIYARVRHPLYLSVIALGFAWALLWRSGPALALAVLQMPFFDLKARREERWLRARYADHDNYSRRVKRFIPGLY